MQEDVVEEEHVPHNPQLDVLLAKMKLNDAMLRRVMRKMTEMMDRGLSNDPTEAQRSSLKMLASYVCAVPDGSESGDHLALDLGGTNFRVLWIKLEPDRHAVQDSQIFVMPNELMTGSGHKLFDYIADCLASFVRSRKLEGKKLPLGFTFSFPCQQENLTAARLITWTKGYKATRVEGEDVAQLLRRAIQRRTGGEAKVVAVLNDTVGTLMALAHEDPHCEIGIILGTGTNACYMEQAERAPKLRDHLRKAGFDQMIVNMEWGAFGDLDELSDFRTEFDVEVDQSSINPKRQTFEKMISGMYMGELARLILVKLVRERLLFGGEEWDELKTKDRFYGHYVSEVVKSTMAAAAGKSSFYKTRKILKDFGADHPTAVDCANVAYVCTLVVQRSARLCAAGIVTLLNRMKKPEMTVGIDGSVYRFNHPYFPDLLREQITALLDVPCEFKLKLSNDGSGRGAALVAAVAARLASEGEAKDEKTQKKRSDLPCVIA